MQTWRNAGVDADFGVMPAASAFVVGLFFGAADFFFGLEPGSEIRAGLVSPEHVQLVGAEPNAFFERECFGLGFFRGFFARAVPSVAMRFTSVDEASRFGRASE